MRIHDSRYAYMRPGQDISLVSISQPDKGGMR